MLTPYLGEYTLKGCASVLNTNVLPLPFWICHSSSAAVSTDKSICQAKQERTGSKSQISVLQHLCKHEALLVVVLAASILRVDITEAGESGLSAAVFVDVDKGVPHPLAVLRLVSNLF